MMKTVLASSSCLVWFLRASPASNWGDRVSASFQRPRLACAGNGAEEQGEEGEVEQGEEGEQWEQGE